MKLTDWAYDTLTPEGSGFVSVTGGGGKTSFMSSFGRFLADRGLRVMITTTTRVMSPRLHDYGTDAVFESESVLSYDPHPGELVFYAEHNTMDMKKWLSPRMEVLSALRSRYDVIVAEADGSRGLPLKIHSDRDPVIHPLTSATVGIMGLWGIGDRIYSSVFGDGRDGIIDMEYLSWYVSCDEGLSKGFAGRTAMILNGADALNAESISSLHGIAFPEGTAVVAASIREDRVYEHIR